MSFKDPERRKAAVIRARRHIVQATPGAHNTHSTLSSTGPTDGLFINNHNSKLHSGKVN